MREFDAGRVHGACGNLDLLSGANRNNGFCHENHVFLDILTEGARDGKNVQQVNGAILVPVKAVSVDFFKKNEGRCHQAELFKCKNSENSP